MRLQDNIIYYIGQELNNLNTVDTFKNTNIKTIKQIKLEFWK